jgi:hypothetical protein
MTGEECGHNAVIEERKEVIGQSLDQTTFYIPTSDAHRNILGLTLRRTRYTLLYSNFHNSKEVLRVARSESVGRRAVR